MEKRLHRSSQEKMIAGVCGGLGEYFDIDPVLVRVIFVLLIFLGGWAIPAYIVLWIVMPRAEQVGAPPSQVVRENLEDMGQEARRVGEEVRSAFTRQPAPAPAPTAERGNHMGSYILGAILVIVGLILLLENLNLLWWFNLGRLWPLVLVAVGILLLLGRGRR